MKTTLLFRLLAALTLLAGLAPGRSLAAHGGDDTDLNLANGTQTPSPHHRTVDSNAPAAATTQPPLDVRYGWPKAGAQGWLKLPPQPDVRYAVVPLQAQQNWPANVWAMELDDLGDVLAVSSTSSQLHLWKPGTVTSGPVSVPVPLDATSFPITPSYAIVLANHVKRMSSDGRVAGGIFKNGNSNTPGGLAAVWSSATGVTTSLSPVLPVLEGNSTDYYGPYGRSIASVVNASGTALGWEAHSGSTGSNLGGTRYPTESSIGHLLGSDANASNSAGPFYFPAALNNRDVSVAIRSTTGAGSAHLTVFDTGEAYDLGLAAFYGSPVGGLEFQALTNGVLADEENISPTVFAPPVVLALKTATYYDPAALYWAHAVQDGAYFTTDWTAPALLQVWDPNHVERISQRIAPPTYARANDRLEIILGDNRLMRNERIYDLDRYLAPAGCWRISATVDINNSGTILAYAVRIKDTEGNDIPVGEQFSEPVLLVPSVLVTDVDPDDANDPNLLQTGTSVAIAFVPIASEIQSLTELIGGRDYITGEPTSRWLAGAGMVLGVVDLSWLLKAKTAVRTAVDLESKFVLKGMTKAEARAAAEGMGLSTAQAASVNSALSRATTTNTIKVTQYGSDVVVQVMRPGHDGFQVFETVVSADGTKTVLQKAYDAAGNLVHYHPK